MPTRARPGPIEGGRLLWRPPGLGKRFARYTTEKPIEIGVVPETVVGLVVDCELT